MLSLWQAPEFPDRLPHFRTRVAINLFKLLLIKDWHVPDSSQPTAVFDALVELGIKPQISERTWESWFATTPVIPKRGKTRFLDEVASVHLKTPTRGGMDEAAVPVGFFTDLVHGGLLSELTKRTKTKHLAGDIRERARRYEPRSELHLHLDAIEVCGLSRGFQAMPWQEFKAIAANRILECLTRRWCPRHGTVYSTLSSDLWLKWKDASDSERTQIRADHAIVKSDHYEKAMNLVPKPNWKRTAVDSDLCETHIYKALFAIGADDEFLIADRLATWTVDMATSAFAMHALAWTDRYSTFGLRATNEQLHWKAFDAVLFCEGGREIDSPSLSGAMDSSNAQWADEPFKVFNAANKAYADVLKVYGVSPSEVRQISMRASEKRQLTYVG